MFEDDNMVAPYAKATQVWTGGPNSLTEPEDMSKITLDLTKLTVYGGETLGKLNFTVEYDITELNYMANISIALIFDKNILVSQTDLKNAQGTAIASFRMPFLPKYANQKRPGTHTLDIVIKLRPRWTIWHMIDNVKDFMELKSIGESKTTRIVVLTEGSGDTDGTSIDPPADPGTPSTGGTTGGGCHGTTISR